MTSVHERWMRLAVKEAYRALREGHTPVGAAIVRHGKLLAVAHDRSQANSDPTAHAEIQALRKATRDHRHYQLPDAVVYTTLEPCPMCAAALIWARVRTVVYGARGLNSGGLGTVLDLRKYWGKGRGLKVVRGVLRGDCDVLRDALN
jgi:tRNA(adenine34) deaminase